MEHPPAGQGPELRFRVLRELGLTEYQAKAYLALVRLGRATAAQVANTTDVPRNKLYPVMQQLNALGLVETLLGESQVFRPLPLDRFLDECRAGLSARAQRLEEERAATLALFLPAAAEPEAAPAGYKVFHGRANLVEQVRGVLRDARQEAYVLGTASLATRLLASGDADLLRERVEEGLRVWAVLPTLPEEEPALRALDEALRGMVRTRPDLPAGTLIVAADEAVALQAQVQPDDASLSRGHDITLLTPSAIVARMAAHYVRSLWAGGRSLDEPPREERALFPAREDWLRRFADALAAARHRVDAALDAGQVLEDPRVAGTLQACAERGVALRVLHLGDAGPALREAGERGLAARPSPGPLPFRFALIDDGLAFVLPRAEHPGPFLGLVVGDPALVADLGHLFEGLWHRARGRGAQAPWPGSA
jgi:sugar-specific transcriptional regulator TrmB